jgi:hypothetical protein
MVASRGCCGGPPEPACTTHSCQERGSRPSAPASSPRGHAAEAAQRSSTWRLLVQSAARNGMRSTTWQGRGVCGVVVLGCHIHWCITSMQHPGAGREVACKGWGVSGAW